MSNIQKYLVEKHISAEELNSHIQDLEKTTKRLNQLYFIKALYGNCSVREACSQLDMPIRTGYNWLEKWNKKGLEGFNHKKGAGRPSFLSHNQLKEIHKFISHNDSLGTKEIHSFIKNKFGINYSLKQVRFIIKTLKDGHSEMFSKIHKNLKNAKK